MLPTPSIRPPGPASLVCAAALTLVALTGHSGAAELEETTTRAEVPAFDPDDPRTSFDLMAEYLARDGGRWRGANPNHDPADDSSPPAFGLWFDRILGGQVLELRIVLHYPDSDVISSSGSFVWHSGREELSYRMAGRRGDVTEGVTSFPAADTFRTVATLYLPGGDESVHRDDNVLVTGSLHRNETFAEDADGSWISRGVYEWRRTRQSVAP